VAKQFTFVIESKVLSGQAVYFLTKVRSLVTKKSLLSNKSKVPIGQKSLLSKKSKVRSGQKFTFLRK
jgi:hypothetical protein